MTSLRSKNERNWESNSRITLCLKENDVQISSTTDHEKYDFGKNYIFWMSYKMAMHCIKR